MNSALWIAKTGLDAQQTRMAVVSNNLANVNTTGFKKGRAAFEDLLYQSRVAPGSAVTQNDMAPTGLTLGTGVRVVATEKSFAQGNLQQTGNSLDLAVNGRGFFQVTMPDGSVAYTRDGSFRISPEGELVTAGGLRLAPSVTLPQGAQSVNIGTDGTVSVTVAGQAAATQVGQVQLADFVNPAGLLARGENLYAETAASGAAQTGTAGVAGFGTLVQGALEASNVNVAEELVNMIETQRAYELNSKAIAATDQMLQFVTQRLG
jgi:flagellar basal-body rod protein FlgG